jgi:hypothetical protein
MVDETMVWDELWDVITPAKKEMPRSSLLQELSLAGGGGQLSRTIFVKSKEKVRMLLRGYSPFL